VRFDEAARARHGDALLDAYDLVDDALGRLLAHTDDSTLLVVILSHGMGDNIVLPDLGDPIVRAIDDAMGAAPVTHRARELARRTPNRIARLGRRALGRPIEDLAHIADGSRRWFPVEAFPTHLALRLNIVGREPNGRIEPGQVAAVIDHLEAELAAVRDVDTGRPIVRRVIRTADHYRHVDRSSVADVLVEWCDDAIVERATSPTIGTVERPLRQTRTGAHRQDGLVVLRGPATAAGARTEISSVDVWPTIATHLGVDPGDVDGQPIVAAAPAAPAAPHELR
jgi:predicted AlkP superfamily phosphohydrolase/phosphomutase